MGWFDKEKPSPPLFIKDEMGQIVLTEEGEKQLPQWEADRKVNQLCWVYIIDPIRDQPVIEEWSIAPGDVTGYGEIDSKTFEEFSGENSDIYAVAHYENGQRKLHFAKRKAWDHVRAMVDKI